MVEPSLSKFKSGRPQSAVVSRKNLRPNRLNRFSKNDLSEQMLRQSSSNYLQSEMLKQDKYASYQNNESFNSKIASRKILNERPSVHLKEFIEIDESDGNGNYVDMFQTPLFKAQHAKRPKWYGGDTFAGRTNLKPDTGLDNNETLNSEAILAQNSSHDTATADEPEYNVQNIQRYIKQLQGDFKAKSRSKGGSQSLQNTELFVPHFNIGKKVLLSILESMSLTTFVKLKQDIPEGLDILCVIDLLKHCYGLSVFKDKMADFLDRFYTFMSHSCISRVTELRNLMEEVGPGREFDADEKNPIQHISRIECIYQEISDDLDQLLNECLNLTKNYYYVSLFGSKNSGELIF